MSIQQLKLSIPKIRLQQVQEVMGTQCVCLVPMACVTHNKTCHYFTCFLE